MLSAAAAIYHARNPGDFEFTLVELDETYCEVARRLLPDAEIICGSIFDPAVQDRLSKKSFDCAISNPPYGSKNVASGKGPRYSRSEEHTSELQSLIRISYAVFCLKKKIKRVTN